MRAAGGCLAERKAWLTWESYMTAGLTGRPIRPLLNWSLQLLLGLTHTQHSPGLLVLAVFPPSSLTKGPSLHRATAALHSPVHPAILCCAGHSRAALLAHVCTFNLPPPQSVAL